MAEHKRLNPREERFCELYVKYANATKAAMEAGFSSEYGTAATTANRLLKKAKINAQIEKVKKNLEKLLGFNKATILEDLQKIKAMSMKAVPVMKFNGKTKEMEQVIDEETGEGVWQYDSNGANRAIENINKMMGYNEPEKVEDVTPAESKKTTIVIQKTYADKESDKPTSQAD